MKYKPIDPGRPIKSTLSNFQRRKNPPQLLKLEFPTSSLRRLPKEHLELFAVFSHALNEINALIKLHILLGYQQYPDDIQGMYASCHRLALSKVFAGKLYESWELIRTRYFGSPIGQSLGPRLTREENQALYFLKRYFSQKDNLIYRIRNEAAFHYPREKISHTAKYLRSKKYSSVYIDANHTCNNLYLAGEFMASLHYFSSFEVLDEAKLLEMDAEIAEVSANIFCFAGGIVNHFISDLIKISGTKTRGIFVTISEKIKMETCSIPVFLDLRKHFKDKHHIYMTLNDMNQEKFKDFKLNPSQKAQDKRTSRTRAAKPVARKTKNRRLA